jgi:hypothetical protein
MAVMQTSLIQLFPRPGLLHAHLQENPNPRLCWYPCSGRRDARPLLYLHPRYREFNPARGPEPEAPDLFLFTDVRAPDRHPEGPPLEEYDDGKTQVKIREWQELGRLDLPVHEELVLTDPEWGPADGRAVFMWVEVNSNRFGSFRRPVIYVCAENASFCAKVLLPNQIRVTHVVQNRYGHLLGGGGRCGPGWIAPLLNRLGAEVFLSDDRWRDHYPGPDLPGARGLLYDLFPELWVDEEKRPELVKLHRPLQGMHGFSPVTWYLPKLQQPQ